MGLTQADAPFLYRKSASGPMHISSVYVLDGQSFFSGKSFFREAFSGTHTSSTPHKKIVRKPNSSIRMSMSTSRKQEKVRVKKVQYWRLLS